MQKMTYDFNCRLEKFMCTQSKMYFLVKDTHWTFIWWHIDSSKVDGELMMIGTAKCPRFVLRIYDVTHIIFNGNNAHRYFDIEVEGFTDHWYLQIDENNRNYLAEAGFRDSGGNFHPLARSNTIFLPPDCGGDVPSEWTQIRYVSPQNE
jgi:hypothetical protein